MISVRGASWVMRGRPQLDALARVDMPTHTTPARRHARAHPTTHAQPREAGAGQRHAKQHPLPTYSVLYERPQPAAMCMPRGAMSAAHCQSTNSLSMSRKLDAPLELSSCSLPEAADAETHKSRTKTATRHAGVHHATRTLPTEDSEPQLNAPPPHPPTHAMPLHTGHHATCRPLHADAHESPHTLLPLQTTTAVPVGC